LTRLAQGGSVQSVRGIHMNKPAVESRYGIALDASISGFERTLPSSAILAYKINCNAGRTAAMRLCAVLISGMVGLVVFSTGPASSDELDQVARARATIRACSTNQVLGVASLYERDSDEGIKEVDVTIRIRERNTVLSEGHHGVHIHEVGDCTASCGAAGGHFDPGPNGNPTPDGNHPFHLGDLINIEVGSNGRGSMRTTTSRVTLSPGPLSVFDANGSAIIIHVGADTYCPNGPATGCAGGARAACGVIERIR
jgi:Cu-Zn family superoxide dismutase